MLYIAPSAGLFVHDCCLQFTSRSCLRQQLKMGSCTCSRGLAHTPGAWLTHQNCKPFFFQPVSPAWQHCLCALFSTVLLNSRV
jgi:hypothetical protein